ncbi:MAG: leucyl aminopeptidase [Paracoccaceae bacterium]
MTTPTKILFQVADAAEIAGLSGKIAIFSDPSGTQNALARKVNTLTKGALARLLESDDFQKLDPGSGATLAFPAGLGAKAVCVVKLANRPRMADARKAGAFIAKFRGRDRLAVMAGSNAKAADIALGMSLRDYEFNPYKTDAQQEAAGEVTFHVSKPEEIAVQSAPMAAVCEGVFFTRDLVNEPANILTTNDFSARLEAMKTLGLKVATLEETALGELGMNALLGVGQGSDAPTKVVVLEWSGGGADAPVALVGKGVVFDSGGLSIKPAAGMEEMTMDMGGAGVVAGVMRTLALRRARANVVGIVGLVENMPDGRAQRPGDVVRSMKGDTIEVINTDAEGRLVLADLLWYAQQTFQPRAMINLATLTGAIVIGLGHENAGVFSNDDALCDAFLGAAENEGEGAWRMPLAKAYDKLLKSRIADMKNTGGRPAGSITAAQFLKRFVKDETPWIHLDIAGVALLKTESDLAPKGATGWGVRALDRLIRDRFESR